MSGPFDGLARQPEAERLLEAALAAPGHAYLLAGPPGSGKRLYAERFSAALLDAPPRRIVSGTHPDLFVLEPAGSMILMEDARRLRRDLHMRPFEAARRVYLILGAHLLRDDSANALLKSLEEPPSYGVFVLVSDHADGMLPTILSRVQLVPFRRFSTAQLTEATGNATAARAAMGNLARAEQLAGDDAAAERRRAYLDIARRSLIDPAFDPAEAAGVISSAANAAGKQAGKDVQTAAASQIEVTDDPKDRKALEKRVDDRAKRVARRAELEELLEALDTVAWWYRDVLAAHLGAESVVVHSDLAGEAVHDGESETPARLVRALSVLADRRRSFDLNVTPPLAIEALFHELHGAGSDIARVVEA
jgi:DNA polymerase-3 subunit delta'